MIKSDVKTSTYLRLFVWFATAICAALLTGCATYPYHSLAISCPHSRAPVSGFAQAFIGDKPLHGAKITVLENGKQMLTNSAGQFGFCIKPYQKITLELVKQSHSLFDNYQTTQTGTFIVPPQGLQGKYHEVTFQVPRAITYATLKSIVKQQHHLVLLPNKCNVATTITAFGKTLMDDPQGEPGAKIILWHGKKLIENPSVLYFGIIFDKTNPLDTKKLFTSRDGGAIIYNLNPSKKLYYLSAKKAGKIFSRVGFLCRPGAFINLSPPHSPTIVKS